MVHQRNSMERWLRGTTAYTMLWALLTTASACGPELAADENSADLAHEDSETSDEGVEDKATRHCAFFVEVLAPEGSQFLRISSSGSRPAPNKARSEARKGAVRCVAAWWAARTKAGKDVKECAHVTGLNKALAQLVKDPSTSAWDIADAPESHRFCKL